MRLPRSGGGTRLWTQMSLSLKHRVFRAAQGTVRNDKVRRARRLQCWSHGKQQVEKRTIKALSLVTKGLKSILALCTRDCLSETYLRKYMKCRL